MARRVKTGGHGADVRVVSVTGLADERQRMGRVAAVAGPLLVLMVLATMPLVGYTWKAMAEVAALVIPASASIAVIAWHLPWGRWSARALLAVPCTGFVCLSVVGVASDGKAAVYGGCVALLFLFVGLTQRPWTSVAVLPLGITTHVLLYGGPSLELAARMPILITVWLATAEIVSRQRTRSRGAFDDMESVAHHDALTGLANRHGLTDRLSSLRHDDAVLLVDLDHFKRLNDNDGHIAGDQVLREFGALVQSVIRAGDDVIRYGGEEILMLLRATDASGALGLDQRLRSEWAGTHPGVTFSGGIAVVGVDQPSALGRADEAMYAAKSRGRNRTLVYPAEQSADTGPKGRVAGPNGQGAAATAPAEVRAAPR